MFASRKALVIIGLCLGSSTAVAADGDNLSTDRPDFLTAPNVVGKGRFQIETGGLVQRDDMGGQRTRTVSTPTLLRLGVSDSLELRLETDGRQRTRETDLATQATSYENGWADVALGFKWNMQKGEKGTPTIGWIVQTDLPSGSRPFRGRGLRAGVLGAFQWELENDFAFSVNAGAKYDNHDTEGRFVAGVLGAGVSKGITDRLSVVLEVVGQDLRSKKYGGNVITADLGVMYLVTPSLQLDALAGRGLTNDSPKYLFTVGASARF